MSRSDSWFEITISHEWQNKKRKSIEATRENRKTLQMLYREMRSDLNNWGVVKKNATKEKAESQFKKIPKNFRDKYEICETCSIPELDAFFM